MVILTEHTTGHKQTARTSRTKKWDDRDTRINEQRASRNLVKTYSSPGYPSTHTHTHFRSLTVTLNLDHLCTALQLQTCWVNDHVNQIILIKCDSVCCKHHENQRHHEPFFSSYSQSLTLKSPTFGDELECSPQQRVGPGTLSTIKIHRNTRHWPVGKKRWRWLHLERFKLRKSNKTTSCDDSTQKQSDDCKPRAPLRARLTQYWSNNLAKCCL